MDKETSKILEKSNKIQDFGNLVSDLKNELKKKTCSIKDIPNEIVKSKLLKSYPQSLQHQSSFTPEDLFELISTDCIDSSENTKAVMEKLVGKDLESHKEEVDEAKDIPLNMMSPQLTIDKDKNLMLGDVLESIAEEDIEFSELNTSGEDELKKVGVDAKAISLKTKTLSVRQLQTLNSIVNNDQTNK